MSAGRVHSVLAAGLARPELLDRWQKEPALLRRYGVDPAVLDLGALRKFAGLAAKIRHNGLRADFPLTFRLLSVAGLEIEVFAAYGAAHRGVYAVTNAERARELAAFLEQWLDLGIWEHALLWDIIRHELALSRLAKVTPATAPDPPGMRLRPTAASVARRHGEMMLYVMRSDPRALAALLRRRAPRLRDVVPAEHHLCYWSRSAAPQLEIVELDALGFHLLSLADGRRSVAEMNRAIGAAGRPSAALLRALAELGAAGLLAFDPATLETARAATAGR